MFSDMDTNNKIDFVCNKPNVVIDDGGRPKKSVTVRPNLFMELTPREEEVSPLQREQWKQQLPHHSYVIKSVAPQGRNAIGDHALSADHVPPEAAPKAVATATAVTTVGCTERRQAVEHSPMALPPRPASPVVTKYAQITLQSHLITPPMSPLTIDTRHEDERKLDLYSQSWESVDTTSSETLATSVRVGLPRTAAALPVQRLKFVSGEEEDDDNDEGDDRSGHDESDVHEIPEIRSDSPGLLRSRPLNEDLSVQLSAPSSLEDQSQSANVAVVAAANRRLESRDKLQKENEKNGTGIRSIRRQALPPSPRSSGSINKRPTPHLVLEKSSSMNSTKDEIPGSLESKQHRKQHKAKRGSAVPKKPKLLFGGRNFNPGSKGWDPKEWGISSSDPEYQSYKEGVKLPELFIQAIMTYAKAIGIIENGVELEPLWLKQHKPLPPASPYDAKKRATPPLATAVVAASSSSSRSRGEGDDMYVFLVPVGKSL